MFWSYTHKRPLPLLHNCTSVILNTAAQSLSKRLNTPSSCTHSWRSKIFRPSYNPSHSLLDMFLHYSPTSNFLFKMKEISLINWHLILPHLSISKSLHFQVFLLFPISAIPLILQDQFHKKSIIFYLKVLSTLIIFFSIFPHFLLSLGENLFWVVIIQCLHFLNYSSNYPIKVLVTLLPENVFVSDFYIAKINAFLFVFTYHIWHS